MTIRSLAQLRSIVHQQQVTINLLTKQLKYVMSMLGINAPVQQPMDNGNNHCNNAHDHTGQATKSRENDAPVAELNQENQSSSWTEVVGKRSDARQHQKLTNYQQSFILFIITSCKQCTLTKLTKSGAN
jgi:hypothetical protein